MRRSMIAVVFSAVSMVGCAGSYGYYASAPPPPLRSEYVGVAPGPGYVWINGYWGWRGSNYVWSPGYYSRPPRPRAVWVAPRWENYRGRYRFHEGRWR